MAALAGCATNSPNYQNQQAFDSPESAVKALDAAVRTSDAAALEAIFGPSGREVLSTGDPGVDKQQRAVFALAMREGWTLERLDSKSRELIVGNEKWPFPIPLVKDKHGWWFDTVEGADEVVARRIGRNELAVIDVCRAYVVAQQEYAAEGRDGKPSGIYAQKIRSSPGKHDGLHWKTSKAADKPSPLGELAAQASAEGYSASQGQEMTPFRGYFYRILTRQGSAAPGGAKDYLVNGEMTGGFALVAWPAEYGNSGVMTFIVNDQGVVFQRDLGEETASIASAMTDYNPDSSWEPAG
jgi:hypothetical protein